MSQQEKIQRIIDQRRGEGDFKGKGHLQAVENKLDFFTALQKLLKNYNDFRSFVLRQIEEKKGVYYQRSLEDVAFEQNVREASPDSVLADLDICIKECIKLNKRFNRDSIGISVIGGAGAGKSTLLQSISGLDNTVIPASDGSDTTGTQSVICNHNLTKTYAEIEFYSKLEIIEQVRKYLEAIGVDDTKHVDSINDISNLNLEAIRDSIKEYDDKKYTKRSLCDYLKLYVENLASIESKLGTSEEVKEHDIIHYVAQHAVGNENEKYYLYLAVKKAKIFKKFDYGDAGKIVLIDTIGMGDTSLGIREKMIKTLQDDSDASILLFKAGDRGKLRETDNETLNFISKMMRGSNLGKWMFWVDNDYGDKNSELHYDSLTAQQKSFKTDCAALYRVRCNDRDDVREKLLMPLLDTLIKNLGDIDNSLLQNVNKLAETAFLDYFELCGKVSKAVSGNFKQNVNVTHLFNHTLYNGCPPFSQALVAVENDFRQRSNQRCVEIMSAIASVLNDIDKYSPFPEDILNRLNLGTVDALPFNVYQYYANSIRNQIKIAFDKKINNDCVVGLQDSVKRQIIGLLYNEGRFSAVPLLDFSDYDTDPIAWMREFIKEILPDYPVLKEACEKIVDFRLNIEGTINYKVNKCLEQPYNPNAVIFGPNDDMNDLEMIADKIEQHFLWAEDGLNDILKHELADTLIAPYNLFYDLINSFRDRLIFSPEGLKELYDFYFDYCSVIWRDEVIGVTQAQATIAEWNAISGKLSEQADRKYFIITIQ